MATEVSTSLTDLQLKRENDCGAMNDLCTNSTFNEGRWTKEEHKCFVQGLELHGKEWKKIASLIPTRSIVQIRTHAQKFFQKVARLNFEKQGKEVPEALKSTAIRSSYNFDSLQKALTEPPVEEFLPSDDVNTNDIQSFKLEPIEAPDHVFYKIKKRDSKLKNKTSKRSKSVTSKAILPTRRSRRKSSKFSTDLKKLSLDTNSEASHEVEDMYGGFDFSAVPVLEGFSFEDNRFSEVSSTSPSSDEESSKLKRSRSTPFENFMGETNSFSNRFLDEFPFTVFESESSDLRVKPEFDLDADTTSTGSTGDDPLVEFMNFPFN